MAVLISSIFWACQHNEIEPTLLDPLAKAKDWTKNHLPPKALSKSQKSGSSTSLEYAFDWEESHLTQFNGKNLLDIPFSYLHNQQIVHTQMVSEAVLNADLLSSNTVHRLLLLEKATHQYEAVVMQIMAEEGYLAQHSLDEVAENVRFNAIPADFSGQVIFLDPQTGRQIQGGKYQNGQLTAKISQEKITCETIITYIYEGTEIWIGGVLMRYDEAELVEIREETICWDDTPPGGGDGGYYGGGGGGSGSTSPPAEEEFCPFEECEEGPFDKVCPDSFRYNQIGDGYSCNVTQIQDNYAYSDGFQVDRLFLNIPIMCIQVRNRDINEDQIDIFEARELTAIAWENTRQTLAQNVFDQLITTNNQLRNEFKRIFANELYWLFGGNPSINLSGCVGAVSGGPLVMVYSWEDCP